MKNVLDILDLIVNEYTYYPLERASSGAIGDDYERFICQLLEEHLKYLVVDCSPNRLLSRGSSHPYTFPLLEISIKKIFTPDVIMEMRHQLDENDRTEYKFDFDFKRNFIVFQPWKCKTPDIMVVQGDNVTPIECKTTTDGRVSFNDSGPKDGYRILVTHLVNLNMTHLPGSAYEYPTKDPDYMALHKKYYGEADRVCGEYLKTKEYQIGNVKGRYSPKHRSQFKPTKSVL